ncbi:MAG: type II toxin-antitoxin system RelE/ParE family toxin [Nitrospira sp.]|nr:type II toxin-antitoxin system RelE/ParE family toxin [Nitrospira sp.]
MTRRLVVQRQSDLDIQAAALWYEDQRPGLGRRFLGELDEVFHRIESNPKQFPQLEHEVRRALLHRFPYGVYFIEGPDDVAILAVLHLHREPDMWKSRN